MIEIGCKKALIALSIIGCEFELVEHIAHDRCLIEYMVDKKLVLSLDVKYSDNETDCLCMIDEQYYNELYGEVKL